LYILLFIVKIYTVMGRTEIKGNIIQDGTIFDVDLAENAAIQHTKIATNELARFVSDEQIEVWDKASIRESNVITVSKVGGDFTSIKQAIDSIVDATATNRYIVMVGNGVFIEPTITMKPYVAIKGMTYLYSIIETQTPNQDLIIGAPNASVFDCMLRGATSTDKSGVIYTGGIGTFRLDGVRFGSNYHYANFNSTNGPCVAIVTRSSAESDAAHTLAFKINHPTGNSYPVQVVVEDFILNTNISTLVDFMEVSGTLAQVLVNQLTCIKTSQNGDVFRVINGAEVRINVANLSGYANGIINPNIGSGSIISANSVVTRDIGVMDVLIQNPYTTGSINGTFDSNKVSVDEAVSGLSANYTDTTNKKVVIFGDLHMGNISSTVVNISDIIYDGSSFGLYNGGTITIRDLEPYTVDISAGFGYLTTGQYPDRYMKRHDWENLSLVLEPQTINYIYFNDSFILSTSSSQPDLKNTILLGRVITSVDGIEFIENTPVVGKGLSNDLELFNRNAIGSVYDYGSTVSINAQNQLSVGSGAYYFSSNRYLPSGINFGDTFYTYHKNSSGDFIFSNTTQITNNYDNAGTLTVIPSGKFVKHSLYTVGTGINERYMLVVGQVLYDSLIFAEGAGLAISPQYFNGSVTLIATIIIDGTDGTVSQVRDERPVIGFKASGVASDAFHGNLLGLSNDDHPQYLKRAGDTMSGPLKMGGNNITSAGTINNVTIQDHHTRHAPNGSDPLGTDVAVSVGENNQEGVSNSFSRADHVHAHGSQSGQTDHAIATTSSHGFMSSTDKQFVQNLTTNGIVTTGGTQSITGAKTFSGATYFENNAEINTGWFIAHAGTRVGIGGLPNMSDAVLQVHGAFDLKDGAMRFNNSAGTPTNVFYTGASEIQILRNYGEEPSTLFEISSKVGNPLTDIREATLALTRTDDNGNSEFIDLYNNGYHTGNPASVQYGFRVQKRGNGVYRPFVMDWFDGTTYTNGYNFSIDNGFIFYKDVTINGANLNVAGTITEGGVLLANKYSLTGHTHTIANVTGLQIALNDRSLTGHTHTITNVTGLQTALDDRSLTGHTHTITNVTGLQTALDDRSLTGHTHTIANVTNLQTELSNRSLTGHTHTIANVTGLQTALDGKANTAHVHNPIVSGNSVSSVASPYTPNVQNADVIDVVLPNSTSTTFLNPSWGATPIFDGKKVIFRIKQGTTGSGLITWDAAYSFPVGTPPTLTTAAGKMDVIGFMYNLPAAKWQMLAITKNL
jgi:hypothetical protein